MSYYNCIYIGGLIWNIYNALTDKASLTQEIASTHFEMYMEHS